MGIFGVAGVAILTLLHFDLASVSQGWEIFWWVMVALNVLSMGLRSNK